MASSGVKMMSTKIKDNNIQLTAKWGKNTVQKREKLSSQTKFQSRSFKTQNSNWTPIVHKPSNEQIFLERRELVSNWFDLWTDTQRKKFLDRILSQCERPQLHFIQNWFDLRVPLKHVDFTNLLPKFLSLYIFSFLDPRSLSRAAQVCWHWKYLTEHDELWVGKCVKRGWYLPYTPSNNENAAWKMHYICCISTLDMDGPSMERIYGRFGEGTDFLKRQKTDLRKSVSQTYRSYDEVLNTRPPWYPPDVVPKDLETTAKAMLHDFNPNDPNIPKSLTLHHNKFGIELNKLTQSLPSTTKLIDYGLRSELRKSENRIKLSEEEYDFSQRSQRVPLSQSLEIESFKEKRMMELVQQPWEPPVPITHPIKTGVNLTGGGNYPLLKSARTRLNTEKPISKTFPQDENPRVIFISSRVPAADLLVDAILFGVIPIVYEYEGTSLEALTDRLKSYLSGRCAQSIGLFVHNNDIQRLNLVLGATVTKRTIEDADIADFLKTVATNILTPEQKGHLDIFTPLAASEDGIEIMTKLSSITGTICTTPTGLIGNYNHVNSEWLTSPETEKQPGLYFCNEKLSIWANVADQVAEGSLRTKKILSSYLEQQNKDICSQITGQILYDSTGLLHVGKFEEICNALQDGLFQISQEEPSNSLEFLGRYLLKRSNVKEADIQLAQSMTPPGGTLKPGMTMKAKILKETIQEDDDSDVYSNATSKEDDVSENDGEENEKEKKNYRNLEKKIKDIDQDESEDDEIKDDISDDGQEVLDMDMPGNTLTQIAVKETGAFKPVNSTLSENFDNNCSPLPSQGEPRLSKSVQNQRPPIKMTPQVLASIADKRTAVAKEILSSETDYRRTFGALKKVYLLPLKSALSNNKAILSAHNLQMIFADAMNILDLSRNLLDDLRNRLEDWNSYSCLGDLFVKFCGQLKVYTNFFQNYSMILHCIEKSIEQIPSFRAFLSRSDKTPATKMLRIQEILLLPSRRILDYVTLLTWFERHTPKDHADRSDLALALKLIKELSKLITEQKTRCDREQQIISLQKIILNCPSLMEANRYFIKQLDVAHLKAPLLKANATAVASELKTYQHVEDLGLFLFNDAVVVTKRTSRHFPYERRVEYTYRFVACSSLKRLRLEDVPDSKLTRDCFRMHSPNRNWYCQTSSPDEKLNWLTIVENAIRATIDDK